MKHLSIVLTLIVLMACGKKESKSNAQRQEQNGRNCLESRNTLCMPSTLWVFNSNSKNFPKNFQIVLNGEVRYDSCRQEPVTITQSIGRVQIEVKLPGETGVERVRLKIVDQGADCKEEATFFEDLSLRIYTSDVYDPEDFFLSQRVYAHMYN